MGHLVVRGILVGWWEGGNVCGMSSRSASLNSFFASSLRFPTAREFSIKKFNRRIALLYRENLLGKAIEKNSLEMMTRRALQAGATHSNPAGLIAIF